MATSEDTQRADAFGDNHPYIELFGTPARSKILAAFVSEQGRDITISYVAQLAGVARSTVYDHLDDLEEMGIIEHTRDMGESSLYQLNEDSSLAAELVRLEGVALATLLGEER